MQIPNFDLAIIEKSKIIDYLLNINHKRGVQKQKYRLIMAILLKIGNN